MTLGLGEPNVSQSRIAFWPSVYLYNFPSSVRIWGGSSATRHTETICTHAHTQIKIKIATCRNQTLTNDIDVDVGEDGSMFVSGPALVDGSVSKVDILKDQ